MLSQTESTHRLEKWARVAAFAIPLDILPLVLGRSPSFFASLILIFFWIEHSLRLGEKSRLPTYFGVTLALWWLWNTVTLFWSVAPSATLLAIVSITVQVVVFLAFIEVMPNSRDVLVWWYVAGATCLAIWALMGSVEKNDEGRVQVAGIDQNVTGLVLTVGFAAAVYLLLFSPQRFRRIPLVLGMGVLVSASIKVGSRTGVGGLVLVIAAAVLISVWRLGAGGSTRFLRAGALMAAAVGGYAIILRAGFVPDRVLEFLENPTGAGDSERSIIIAAYREHMELWWTRGVGYGADAHFLSLHSGLGFKNAHSLFWKTWIETGMVGLLLWGAFLVGVVRVFSRSLRVDALGLLLAVPITAFAFTLGGDRTGAFWFVLAACLTPLNRSPRIAPAAGSGEQGPLHSDLSGSSLPTSPIRGQKREME